MARHFNMNPIWVVKTSGERQRFSFTKLRRSLIRSGADKETIQKVVEHITPEIKDGVKTSVIYKHAFAVLKKLKYPSAVRYSLRKAVMELGPSGFPFERYVAEVLRRKGYKAQTGVVLQGACVNHEVDIYLEKDGKHIFAECKFKNQQGLKVDVKTALYVYARFLDLQRAHSLTEEEERKKKEIHEGWLITNTKLTSDAVQYANCVGLRLIGWDYPEQGNLQDLILETGVHPLTFLSGLSAKNKADLLEQGVVMCRELKTNNKHLRGLGFSDEKIREVVSEVDKVCQEF